MQSFFVNSSRGRPFSSKTSTAKVPFTSALTNRYFHLSESEFLLSHSLLSFRPHRNKAIPTECCQSGGKVRIMLGFAIIASTDIEIKRVSHNERIARSGLHITSIPCMKIFTYRKESSFVLPVPMETVFAPAYQYFIPFFEYSNCRRYYSPVLAKL